MHRTTYHIDKMDCSAEEQMVRMQLEGLGDVVRLEFDLPARQLGVIHDGDGSEITEALHVLHLGARVVDRSEVPDDEAVPAGSTSERRPLALALAINAALFVGEFTFGLLSGSMGLIADSLDMLADAFVYALSLAAVGGSVFRKKRLARASGIAQLTLAVLGLVEVLRRFAYPEGVPDVGTMVIVAAIALVGNAVTLWLLSRTKRGEVHVEASWIFTSNDIKVNALVIVSALVVWGTSSAIPDLLAGAAIFVIVANGARQILALAR